MQRRGIGSAEICQRSSQNSNNKKEITDMSSCTPKVAPRNLGNLISHQHVADYKTCDSLNRINTKPVLNKSELLTVTRGWEFIPLKTSQRSWSGFGVGFWTCQVAFIRALGFPKLVIK